MDVGGSQNSITASQGSIKLLTQLGRAVYSRGGGPTGDVKRDHWRVTAEVRLTWDCFWCARNGQRQPFPTVHMLCNPTRHLEVVDLLSCTAVVHVTDLKTIKYLHRQQERPWTSFETSLSAFLRLRSLSITLRPPLNFYQTLERFESVEATKPELSSAAQIWLPA